MKKTLLTLLVIAAGIQLHANEPWTVERCMQYAAEHSHTVRQQKFLLDDSRAAKTQAIGAFLPSVYGSVSGQLNFGRAIDPETNTYTNVSTLYNGYGLQTSLTIFDGLQRYNELRMAKANEAMGRSGLAAEKDDVALKVYKAYMDLVYCLGAVDTTSFYRNMDHGNYTPFSEQFKNNAGEYVALSLHIPIFNRLATSSTIRRRKIALEQAKENYEYEQSELRRIIVEATADVENSAKEVEKMRVQVESDSIAAHLTTRKYEEGLASSIDVKTAAVTLLQSRVKMLQSQLTMAYNRRFLAYYNGESLWNE